MNSTSALRLVILGIMIGAALAGRAGAQAAADAERGLAPAAAPASASPPSADTSSAHARAGSAQAEAGEPRADTSAPDAGPAAADQGAGSTPTAGPSTQTAVPAAGTAAAARSGAAAGAAAGAGVNGATASRPPSVRSSDSKGVKPGGSDRLDLGVATVTGDREQPKVMYIVPWKKADIGDLSGKPMNSLLDEALAPVDRDEFKREVMYYNVVKADASQNGAQSPPAKGEK